MRRNELFGPWASQRVFLSSLQVCRDDGKIVVAKKEMDSIMRHFYERYKRENTFKLSHRIRETYVGISKEVIQSWINSNEEHFIRNPIFANKPMERIQTL